MTDWDRETRLLATPLGQVGSGRVRYAAAMQFHRAGRISDAALEVYRICAANDAEDPATLLAQRGETSPPTDLTPAQHIHNLVGAVRAYLATLSGPGLAEVMQGLAAWTSGPVTPQARANATVAAHLTAALAALQQDRPALAQAIGAASPYLPWITYELYDRDLIGTEFAAQHAYVSLIGDDHSTLPATSFDLGLFLIAPHVLYRDHAHAAPELYAPLTGPHGWRFGPDQPLIIKPAHLPVWNDTHAPHLTKAGPVPFLCIYAWTRDVDAAAYVIPATDWPALESLRLQQEPA